MPDFYSVTIRAIGAYAILYALTRMMGKREISQLTYFDYVVGITIGTLAGTLATDLSSSFWVFLPAILVFALFQFLSAYLSLKSESFRRLFEGTPTMLIERGQLLRENMRKTRINSDELSGMLRGKNAFSFGDVEFAVLETDGKLSVQKKADKKSVTPSDLGLSPLLSEMPQIVVSDGNVDASRLKEIGLSEAWLTVRLAEQGVCDTEQVMLAQVDGSGRLLVQFRELKATEEEASPVFMMLDKLHADFSVFQRKAKSEEKRIVYRQCLAKIDKVKSLLKMYET